MKHTHYHKVLRISAVVLAAVVVFDGGYIFPLTKSLSDNTWQYLANSVGITANVEETELNEITAEITERQRDLEAREAALNEREIATRNFGNTQNTDYSMYILSTILFILTVLIVLNYALDFVRERRTLYEREAG